MFFEWPPKIDKKLFNPTDKIVTAALVREALYSHPQFIERVRFGA